MLNDTIMVSFSTLLFNMLECPIFTLDSINDSLYNDVRIKSSL